MNLIIFTFKSLPFLRWVSRNLYFFFEALNYISDRSRKTDSYNLQMAQRIEAISALLKIHDPIDKSFVRIGGAHDGGYVMVNDFQSTDFFLSFGVGDNVSWDQDVSLLGQGVHLYDHTIQGLPGAVPGGKFFKEAISGVESSGMTTFDGAVARVPKTNELIVKMDIEGSEWEALKAASNDSLSRVRQMVVEFHGLRQIKSENRFQDFHAALLKLNETHSVVHVHGQNATILQLRGNRLLPDTIEVTYYRNTETQFASPKINRSENLDATNLEGRPEVSLNFI